MVSRANEAPLIRVTAWAFYLLGVTDGVSASLETFKTLNPEPLDDAEWRTKLRSYLPPELAALRHPNANREVAARVIEQELRKGLQRKNDKRPRKRDSGI